MKSSTVLEIAQMVGGEVVGEGSTIITGFSTAAGAGPQDLTFAENEKYFQEAESSAAAAILSPKSFSSSLKTLIRVSQPRVAMARVLPLFFPPETFPAGIDPLARIDAAAEVHPTAHVGAGCVVGPGVRIGARTALLGGNHLRKDIVVGEDTVLHPNVILYPGTQIGNRVIIHAGSVIGSDGYGYVFDEGKHRKVLQLGNVVIEDDVEIGANTAIDRGALGSTRIGKGTKIDNLVHVAHNVSFGKHCLIMGQAGFAGSTTLGDYCVIASQSGIAGHLKLGVKSTVGAKSGVMRDVPDGSTVLGIPAGPHSQTKRQWIALQQLPDLLRRLKEVEEKLKIASPDAGLSSKDA